MAGLVDKMTFVPKTWGNEIWVTNNEKYCGKVLSLDRDKYCSYHYHLIKDEVLLVTEGRVLLIYSVAPIKTYNRELIDSPGFKQTVLVAGQAWRIEPSVVHQFYGLTDAKITEFSTQHLDDDSYRITTKFIGNLAVA